MRRLVRYHPSSLSSIWSSSLSIFLTVLRQPGCRLGISRSVTAQFNGPPPARFARLEYDPVYGAGAVCNQPGTQGTPVKKRSLQNRER